MTTDTTIPISLNQTARSENDLLTDFDLNRNKLAYKDLVDGIKKWPLCLALAYQDLKIRYRRSVLGPFWITISMAVTVYSMGFLYGRIFHADLKSYYPFLVGGMIAWTLISTTINDVTGAYTAANQLIRQFKLPFSLYIHRIVTRHILIFFHNIVVIIPIILIFHQTARVDLNTLLLIPDLFLLYVNFVSYGIILAILGTRFRDISQIIKSIIQIIFFLTPVVWKPDMIAGKLYYIVMCNPFYAFVELIRLPLIGMRPSAYVYGMASSIAILGLTVCIFMFKRYRSRIMYWL